MQMPSIRPWMQELTSFSMESKIAEHIVTRLESFITPYYEYAEQLPLPYCVFEVEQEQPLYSKLGVNGYKADVSVYLAAATEQQAQQLKNQAVEALTERRSGFMVAINSSQPAFAEEQWLWKIDLSITQL